MAREVLICSKSELAQASRSNSFGSLSKAGEFDFSVIRSTETVNGKFVIMSAIVDNRSEIVTLRLGNVREFAQGVPKLLIIKGEDVFINTADYRIKCNPRVTGFVAKKVEVPAEETV